jgi:hypothetical protein
MTAIHSHKHMRELREDQASRRLGVAKALRETPNATDIELAKIFDVSRNTIAEDRKYLMTQIKQDAKTEMQLYREDQLTRIEKKWNEIETDPTMSGAEKHLAWSRWMKLEMDLRGTAAPTRSVSTNVNVNVDPLTMGMYDRFLHECGGLTPEQYEQVWQFMRNLPRTPVDINPPLDAPTWHLTEGEADETDSH